MVKKRKLVPATARLELDAQPSYREQDPPDLESRRARRCRQVADPLGRWTRCGSAATPNGTRRPTPAEWLPSSSPASGRSGWSADTTVQDEGRIEVRFEGRVFLIDTGMLSSVYEGGRPSALVIDNGTFSAVYPDGSSEVLVDEALAKAA